MATGTPETGLLPLIPWAASIARPMMSASQKPDIMTIAAAAIPGSRDMGKVVSPPDYR